MTPSVIANQTQKGSEEFLRTTFPITSPFDRCDREEDYHTAWKFFEENS